jgi:membrane protein DedA with SNARE-associated domain
LPQWREQLPATASHSGSDINIIGRLRGWPLNRFPWLIERSAQLIRKYGIASVFLARFTAVVRAFVPLLAGVLKMSSRHFYVANILSALVWAPMHIFPGVLVGLAIAFGGAHAPELSFAAIGVLILAWIAWSMIKRKTARIMDCSDNQDAAGAHPPRPYRTARGERN